MTPNLSMKEFIERINPNAIFPTLFTKTDSLYNTIQVKKKQL